MLTVDDVHGHIGLEADSEAAVLFWKKLEPLKVRCYALISLVCRPWNAFGVSAALS